MTAPDLTPEAMARLHRAAFVMPEPWPVAGFEDALADPRAFVMASPCARAFLIGRVVADEAELLTLATDPQARRQGLAGALLARFDAETRARGATAAFLEVAETNQPARALYARHGWVLAGRRPGYFRSPQGSPVAALILRKAPA